MDGNKRIYHIFITPHSGREVFDEFLGDDHIQQILWKIYPFFTSKWTDGPFLKVRDSLQEHFRVCVCMYISRIQDI